MESAPGDAESSGSFALVTACLTLPIRIVSFLVDWDLRQVGEGILLISIDLDKYHALLEHLLA